MERDQMLLALLHGFFSTVTRQMTTRAKADFVDSVMVGVGTMRVEAARLEKLNRRQKHADYNELYEQRTRLDRLERKVEGRRGRK